MFSLLDHIGLRGGGVLGARDALGVVTYPNHQLLFDPVQFESGNLLQIAQMLAQQTGIQVCMLILNAYMYSLQLHSPCLTLIFGPHPQTNEKGTM